jgi:hypothetical protein
VSYWYSASAVKLINSLRVPIKNQTVRATWIPRCSPSVQSLDFHWVHWNSIRIFSETILAQPEPLISVPGKQLWIRRRGVQLGVATERWWRLIWDGYNSFISLVWLLSLFSCQLVNTGNSSPADDVHHYVIPPRLLLTNRLYFQQTSGIHAPVGKRKVCSSSGRSSAPVADSFNVATMARKRSVLNLREINRNNKHTALASVWIYYGWVFLIF